MIIETSAVVAVVSGEPDADLYYDAIRSAPSSRLSAASYLEVAIVIDSRRQPAMSRRLDAMLESPDVTVAPVTRTQAGLARQAYQDYGKGSGHPAQLNFGDCLSYALAVDADEPLLYKGDDFVHTDVRSALA